MKNLILALLLFAGLNAMSANNEIFSYDDEFGTCTVTVTFYDSDGNVTGSQTYQSWQPDELSCQIWAAKIGRLYQPMQ